MRINYLELCEKGRKTKVCEDYVALPEINEKYEIFDLNFKTKGCLFALCDGMGGHNAGEIASELCANWLVKDFYRKKIDKPILTWFKDQIVDINERIFKLANENDQYSGMGTTLVSLLLTPKYAYIHNVGDSRLYLYDNRLVQITEDHSEVWQLYKQGLIEKDEIINNRKKNIITEAIGTNAHVKMNSYAIEVPEKFIFLLCSDGLTDVMTDGEIDSVIKNGSNLNGIADSLYRLSQKKGSKDDVSIILVSNYLENSKEKKYIALDSFVPEFDDEVTLSSLEKDYPRRRPDDRKQAEESEPVKEKVIQEDLRPENAPNKPEVENKKPSGSRKGLIWILLIIIIAGITTVTTCISQKKKIDELNSQYMQAKEDLAELRSSIISLFSGFVSIDSTFIQLMEQMQHSEEIGDAERSLLNEVLLRINESETPIDDSVRVDSEYVSDEQDSVNHDNITEEQDNESISEEEVQLQEDEVLDTIITEPEQEIKDSIPGTD
jgi:protein phosphatase